MIRVVDQLTDKEKNELDLEKLVMVLFAADEYEKIYKKLKKDTSN